MLRYFAYGSNMLCSRLERRGVVLLDRGIPAQIDGYRLAFNKASKDGSSKANLMRESMSVSWGVLFRVREDSLGGLDEAERAPTHYRRESVTVETAGGKSEAMTYVAQPNKILSEPDTPWDWYVALILAGAATYAEIPREWLRTILERANPKSSQGAPCKGLPEAIQQLKSAGCEKWQKILTTDWRN
jgi:cation transport regulator ChaC